MDKQSRPILEVKNLKKYYPITSGLFRSVTGQVKAVDNVTFTLLKGEIMGLVGESGCGKTTLGHTIMSGHKPTAGEIIYHDDKLGAMEVASADAQTLKLLRRRIQMIFQDPFASLSPRMTVKDIVAEPLRLNKIADGKAAESKVAELLELVGLRPEHMTRFPHAFSGGQRQRIGIARALAVSPDLIVADEPVSALDVSIQAQTLNLLKDLQQELSLTILFIAHDLSVVEHISDRVTVMYVGKIVETASTDKLFYEPKHPYTEALLSSVPKPNPLAKKERIILEGEVPSAANPPTGCAFHPRCRYAKDICKQERPPLVEVEPEQYTACHFVEELELRGVEELIT